MDLTGRRILVTGASSGIGRETAVVLSQLGAQLVLSGRDEARLQQTLASLELGDHRAAPFDMAEPESLPAWIKDLSKNGGHFHGLVHSAGVHSAMPLRVLTLPHLERMMRLNFHAGMMAVKGLRQKGCCAPEGSSVVLLSSVAALCGEPGIAAYSATKAAVSSMARSLAVELAPEKIRVNAVAPGFVLSEMSQRMTEALTEEQYAAIRARHPIGIGTVRDVANGIAFLLGDCARWITGTTMAIDGGYTAQ